MRGSAHKYIPVRAEYPEAGMSEPAPYARMCARYSPWLRM
jgi:hypothetical protein